MNLFRKKSEDIEPNKRSLNKKKIASVLSLLILAGGAAANGAITVEKIKQDNATIRTIKNDPSTLDYYLKLKTVKPLLGANGEQAKEIVITKNSSLSEEDMDTLLKLVKNNNDNNIEIFLKPYGVDFKPVYTVNNKGLVYDMLVNLKLINQKFTTVK